MAQERNPMKGPDNRLPARPDDCGWRIYSAAVSSSVAGALMGGVRATWNSPRVVRGGAVPALISVLGVIGNFSMSVGAIGTTFAVTDCISETVREKKDQWNGAAGGLAGGAVLGARIGHLGWGLLAGTAWAGCSMLTEYFDYNIRGEQHSRPGGKQKGFFPESLSKV